MKNTPIQIMGDTEYEVSRILNSLGLSKVSSKALACLSSMSEMSSRELEITAGIRQPEVSSAMRILHENDWIVEREVKINSGKGRPVKYYKLSVSMDEIINNIEAARQEDFENTITDIKCLRELVEGG